MRRREARRSRRWVLAVGLMGCAPVQRVDLVTLSAPVAPTQPVQHPRRVEPDGPCNWDVVDNQVTLDGEPQYADSAMRGDDEPHQPASATEIDLDGRPPADLVVDLGMCGSSLACQTVVLQACDGGGYRALWGPEYANGIEVDTHPRRSPIADLLLYSRHRVPACDLPLRTRLRWNGRDWDEGETCSGEGPLSDSETEQEEWGCNAYILCGDPGPWR